VSLSTCPLRRTRSGLARAPLRCEAATTIEYARRTPLLTADGSVSKHRRLTLCRPSGHAPRRRAHCPVGRGARAVRNDLVDRDADASVGGSESVAAGHDAIPAFGGHSSTQAASSRRPKGASAEWSSSSHARGPTSFADRDARSADSTVSVALGTRVAASMDTGRSALGLCASSRAPFVGRRRTWCVMLVIRS